MSEPRQCEFCDKELPPQSEYDACDNCIELMKTLINDPPVRTLQPSDEWGHCTRCGSFVRNDDIWHENCSRTAELAELEREIGRAVIDAGVIFHSTNPAIDELIAQWRKLHTEGAEGSE